MMRRRGWFPLHFPWRHALGSSASTPFIGTGRNNFSHGERIIFKHCVRTRNKGVLKSGSGCIEVRQRLY
jgi:hypothetical protein